MAPTEGRVTRPERRWGCRRGTPRLNSTLIKNDSQEAKRDTDHYNGVSKIIKRKQSI